MCVYVCNIHYNNCDIKIGLVTSIATSTVSFTTDVFTNVITVFYCHYSHLLLLLLPLVLLLLMFLLMLLLCLLPLLIHLLLLLLPLVLLLLMFLLILLLYSTATTHTPVVATSTVSFTTADVFTNAITVFYCHYSYTCCCYFYRWFYYS